MKTIAIKPKTKEVEKMLEHFEAMTKEELISAIEALQTKLSALEKENLALKELAEIGQKYIEHLRREAVRLVRLVDGEKSPLLKLIEKADVETLKELVDEYTEKAKELYKPSSQRAQLEFEKSIEEMSYAELKKLAEKLAKEV
jgi:acyl-CoA reductase-like NAD-dependent aldehyde dehydrogenase